MSDSSAIVDVMAPKPGQVIVDPVCGPGIFYAQGVKANVLFFECKEASPRRVPRGGGGFGNY